MTDFTDNDRNSVLLSGLLASLPVDGNQFTPTPAEPGVINIDNVSDNQGTHTGLVDNFGVTDDLMPTLSGNPGVHAAGSIIQICINTDLVGSAVVKSDGTWTFTPSQPLGVNHEYIFQTIIQDPGSKQFLISLPYTIYTTSTNGDIPATVTLDSVVDDVAGYKGFTGNLKDGGLTNDSHPALSGHATAGAVVNIYDNGILLASTTAAADGSWKYTPSAALTDGTHNLEVIAVNATGQSQPAVFSIVVDTTVTKPVVDSATDDQGLNHGNVASGGVTDDSRPVLHGYAEPNSRVDIHVFGPNGNELYFQSVQSAADGSWSYQPQAFTAYGKYSFGVSSVDAAGNAWYDYGTKFTLNYVGTNQDDTTAPNAATNLVLNDNVGAIKGQIHNQDNTDDNTPTLTGKAEAGATVVVSDHGVVLGSTTVATDGSWSFTPSTALADGPHSITTVVKDAAGQSSNVSDAIAFTVDTHTDAPVITGYQDDVGVSTGTVEYGGRTDDRDGLLSGHAEAGSIVKLTMWGPRGMRYSNVASTVADHDGNWHIQLSEGSTLLGNRGYWTFQVSARDEAGNTATSSKFKVNYVSSNQDDITAPDTPVINDYTDNVGSSKGNLASGTETDDSTPTLNGHAEAGSIVKVYEGTTLLGTTTASSSGDWHFTPSARSVGNHTFTATATDASGNTSAATPGFVVKIAPSDTTAPDAPVITNIYDDVGATVGNVENGGKTDDAQVKVSGTAEANSIVTVYVRSPEGKNYTLGHVTTDSTGHWEYQMSGTQDINHTKGNWIFTAKAADADGNVSGISSGYTVESVGSDQDGKDTTPPDAPVIISANDNVGSQQGTVINGGSTDDKTPEIIGTAEANSIVILSRTGPNGANYTMGSVQADSDGQWHFTVPGSGTGEFRYTGPYHITAIARDEAGNRSEKSDIYTVKLVGSNQDDTTAPDAPTITQAYDDVGTSTGNIKSGATTDDTTPKLSGHAEANSVVKIYDGGSLLGSTTANSSGNWTFTPPARAEGSHTFTAIATDAAGNASDKSAGFVVNIDLPDTTPPAAPVITSATDNVGVRQGPVANGGSTDDKTPEIIGTAEANSIVILSRTGPNYGTYLMGSVQADSHGQWHFTVPDSGSGSFGVIGDYRITAVARDAAGNRSDASKAYTLEYVNSNQDDTTAPNAPTITSGYDDVGSITGDLANGNITNDTTPKLSGHAEANSVVRIYDGSSVIGSTTANSNGSWIFTPPARNEGKHTFTATATDVAGNTSGHSDSFTLTIDTHATVSIKGLLDDSGVAQGLIPDGGKSDDLHPTLTGTADAGSTVYIHEEVPSTGYSFSTTVVADSNGKWVWDLGVLQLGQHNYTAYSVDAAGNKSDEATFSYERVNTDQDDITAPDAPLISNYYDNVGASTGSDGNGGTTDDTTPTLNGTAEANSKVSIYEGNTLLGTTIASSGGSWSYTPPVRAEGSHTFTATATDKAGNVSGHSANFVVHVDIPDYDFTETFNSQSQTAFYNSAVYHLQYFDVTVFNKGSNFYSPGFNGKFYSVSKPVSSTALVMGEGSHVKLDMKHSLTDISFKVGDLTTDERLSIQYLNSHGDVIGTQVHTRAEGLLTTVSFHAPAGEDIASINFSFTNPLYLSQTGMTYIWIDDITGHSSGVTSYAMQLSTTYLEAQPPAVHETLAHDVTLATLPESTQPGTVELHDGSQNTLQLTLNDILSEAHDNLFVQDGHKQLAITGDVGDVVELKVEDLAQNTWQDAGQVTAGGVQYEVYHHTGSNVELLVQQGLELHQVS